MELALGEDGVTLESVEREGPYTHELADERATGEGHSL